MYSYFTSISAHQLKGLPAPATTTATAAAATADPAESEEVPSATASQAAARPTAGKHGHAISVIRTITIVSFLCCKTLTQTH